MAAVLADDELAPFLAGDILEFELPPELHEVGDAPNPLVKPKPPPAQGELF